MQIVPLNALPAQSVFLMLANQNTGLNIYQKTTGLFVDVYIGNTPIITGVLALNNNLIVRNSYLGFVGDFAFEDTQGNSDPDYTGLAGRFLLCYFAPSEIKVPT